MKITLKMLTDVQKDIVDLTKAINILLKQPRTKKIEAELKKYRTALRGAKATKKYMEEQI